MAKEPRYRSSAEGKRLLKNFHDIKGRILEKLQELYGDNWESSVNDTKKECLKGRLRSGDEDDFDLQEIEWTEAIDLNDIKLLSKRIGLNQKIQPLCHLRKNLPYR